MPGVVGLLLLHVSYTILNFWRYGASYVFIKWQQHIQDRIVLLR